MTTYELPPEPPVGSKVHPSRHPDVVWYRSGRDGGWSTPGRPWYSWAQLLGEYEGQGLTLIEPDPWPTAPLIVADWAEGDQRSRGLLVADGPTLSELYVVLTGDDDYDGYRILRRGWDGDTLANVVPVKPVPVAELDALTAAIRDHGVVDCYSEVVALLDATDALGLDQ